MELDQVRYFLALCKEKNFSRAARRCGVSQPSLSNAIKKLEYEFGGPLFHRSVTETTLSDFGLMLRPHLAKLEQHARDVYEQAKRFRPCTEPRARPNNAHRGIGERADPGQGRIMKGY